MRFHRAGPSRYIYDGVRGRYTIEACPIPRRINRSRVGWEVCLPETGAFTKVGTLREARRLIAAHDGVTDD